MMNVPIPSTNGKDSCTLTRDPGASGWNASFPLSNPSSASALDILAAEEIADTSRMLTASPKREVYKSTIGFMLDLGRPVNDEEYLAYVEGQMILRQEEEAKRAAATIPNGCEPVRTLKIEWAANKRIEQQEWLVPGYVPLGTLTILAGRGGVGKDLTTMHLIASLTRGLPAFGLNYPNHDPATALIFAMEDSFTRTILPRLVAAGADTDRIGHVRGIEGDDGRTDAYYLADENLKVLRHTLEEDRERNIRLLVINPISAYLGPYINEFCEADLRRVLDPLSELADELGISIVAVKHPNKNDRQSAGDRISGSAAYRNVARAVYFFGKINEIDDSVMACEKFNLGKEPPSLGYRIEQLEDPTEIQTIVEKYGMPGVDPAEVGKQLVRVKWTGKVQLSADDILRAQKPSQAEKCASFILGLLKKDGDMPVNKAKNLAKAEGFTENAIRNAVTELIRKGHKSQPKAKGGEWWLHAEPTQKPIVQGPCVDPFVQ